MPGVAAATGESGFPGGTVRPGLVDVIAVTADRGTSAATLAARIRADLPGGAGYTVADRRRPRRAGQPGTRRRGRQRPRPRRRGDPDADHHRAVRAGRDHRARGRPAPAAVRAAPRGRRHPGPGPPRRAGRAGAARGGRRPARLPARYRCSARSASARWRRTACSRPVTTAASSAWFAAARLRGSTWPSACFSALVAARRAARTSPARAVRGVPGRAGPAQPGPRPARPGRRRRRGGARRALASPERPRRRGRPGAAAARVPGWPRSPCSARSW